MGRGTSHVHRSYDFDEDSRLETLVLNTNEFSAGWIEMQSSGIYETIWSFNLQEGGLFADGELIDINNDSIKDIVLIPDLFSSFGEQNLIYIFLGNNIGFTSQPITIKDLILDYTTIRPSNLALISGSTPQLAVSIGSPVRKGLLFDIKINDNNRASIENKRVLSSPIISNGYGAVYIGSFMVDTKDYIAILSPENYQLKTSIFDISEEYKLIDSQSFNLKNSKNLLGADIQSYKSKKTDTSGLLIPFESGEVFLLSVKNKKAHLSNTGLSGKDVFPKVVDNFFDLIKRRMNFDILDVNHLNTDNVSSRYEEETLLPPTVVAKEETAYLNNRPMDYEKNITSLPLGEKKNLKKQEEDYKKDVKDYSELSPTLSDFLRTIKDDTNNKKHQEEEVSVPSINEDMKSVNWADEAGFTQLELGEYKSEIDDSISKSIIPNPDVEIATFSKGKIDSLQPMDSKKDTLLDYFQSNGIALYYVLAMTPVSETRDRYVFDGEAPFGVAVNQIPSMGKATHLQHGISADLNTLEKGKTYDFAYSLRDARLDSITTLTMVHDMQTNVVFMSISPTQDSLSQSYEPEAFDPKLFEFPDYFFEGFPSSLDMDFTDKLIRFSFNEEQDSTYKGIYLSSTTPSKPFQSLAVFMDEGILQTIRGEVIVRENGYKKVTTEYDLVGSVSPAALFSRLMQETFSEELKIRLLQGASLEQPLFGPSGKLPKITREPRLPAEEPDQLETVVPVEPKQSNVPSGNSNSINTNSDTLIITPQTQKDEVSPSVLEVEKQMRTDSTEIDSLKLEAIKEKKINLDKGDLSMPEENQPEEEVSPATLDTTKTDSVKPEQKKVNLDKGDLSIPEENQPEEEVSPATLDTTKTDSVKPEQKKVKLDKGDLSMPEETQPEEEVSPATLDTTKTDSVKPNVKTND